MFLVFLVTAPMLMFVTPAFNLLLTVSSLIVFMILNHLFVPFETRLINMQLIFPVAPIAIFFAWFVNMYRTLASFNAIKVEDERNKYRAQSTIDELTQLGNRRDFEQRFQRYLTNYRMNENFLCLAIMDIDYFKNYNDHYGHPKGDECLRSIGLALAGAWDNSSIYAARIGGEEFAVLWFEKDKNNAKNVILQIQQRISALKIPHEKSNVSPYVTFSIGVHIEKCGECDSTQDIYNSADNALYEAKDGGRNGAVIFLKGEKLRVLGAV